MSTPAASSAVPPQPGPPAPGQPGGLRAGALRAGDVVVLSLASSGPTQSIAVTLAALLATIGYASFLPLLICFIPMLGIGVLLAIFLYSGWDTAAYVGEEAKGKKAGPAAVTSVILLFFIYTIVILAFQGVAPNHVLQNNAANILAYVGHAIGGGFWKQVMIVAVLGGTLASLQAAIVSSSRSSFAMGRDRVFPRWLSVVNEKHQTPWNATILFGLLNLVFLWGSTLIGSIGQALGDIASTLGLMAAIFYLLTAGTAVWYYRRVITASAANLILGGILPGLGARPGPPSTPTRPPATATPSRRTWPSPGRPDGWGLAELHRPAQPGGRTSISNSLPSGSAMSRHRKPSSSRVPPGSSHRPPRASISAVAASRSSTTRSRCRRFLPSLASGTRWNPTVRPSLAGDRITNWPSPIVSAISTPSSPHQNGTSRSGSAVSMTRNPTDAGIAHPRDDRLLPGGQSCRPAGQAAYGRSRPTGQGA
jgi:hypothetical protein